MNLGDPELELIDPTPNIHSLFIQFDNLFFWTKLASRAVVRWSKRMYSCAGVCSYEGRGGLCDIALSEPLLKLRPRKDLVQTLLHEMIHAFLFVTCRDQDRDGHGPNFKAHMYRINQRAGLNISIYHDFHDEVMLYQTHWWRCDGPCTSRRPHFGIVRKTVNRAPGPSDSWWECHKRSCGGTFIKIKEPEKQGKPAKKTAPPKPKEDITKYIKTQKTTNNNISAKPVLKDSNNIPVKTKSNGASTVVITKKGPIFNPQVINKPPDLFSGKGHLVDGGRQRSNSVGVLEQVRNVWANKVLPESTTAILNNKQNVIKSKPLNTTVNINNFSKANKHKADSPINSPPTKIKKIDDYFKNTASTVLKNLYGKDFQVTQPENCQKLVAVAKPHTEIDKKPEINLSTSVKVNVVDCPVCNSKISSNEINRHLDECLNKEVIETLTKDNQIQTPVPTSTSKEDKKHLKEIVGVLPTIPTFKGKSEDVFNPPFQDLEMLQNEYKKEIIKLEKEIKKEFEENDFDSNDVNKVKEIVQKINHDKHIRQSGIYDVPKEERPNNVDFGFLPSFLDDIACEIKTPKVKIEPGTSRDGYAEKNDQKCACCGNKVNKPIEEHLDECLAFFGNNTTIPEEGASTSFANETIVIDDDDDIFDETLTMNATGTKTPCPCCLKMVEEADMNAHLDHCLS